MRFRKTIKAGGVRFNISKSGIGASIGTKGFRVGYSPSKGAYSAYGIPGTGIYDVKYHNSGHPSEDSNDFENESTNSINKNYFDKISIPDEFKQKDRNPIGCSNPIGCIWGFVSFILLCICFPLGIMSIITEIVIYNYISYGIRKKYENTKEYKAETLYKNFLNLVKQKDYQTGKNILKQLIEMYPDLKRLKTDYTEYCLLANDYDGAYNSLKEYCESDSELIQLIHLAFKLKYYEQAIEYSKRLSHGLLSNMRIVTLLCECYDKLEKYQELITYLQSLNSETKADVRVITFLGLTYIKLKQYDLALEILSQGPTRKRNMDDNMAKFRYCLGLAYEYLGKKKNAIKQYNKIIVYDAKYKDVEERIKKLSE